VDVGVASDPGAQRRPAGVVVGERLERLRRRPHLPSDLAGEVPEHVVLAGEVLVDRHARATGHLGDALQRRALVAVLAEHLQGGVEDPLLRPQPARPDRRVVGVGRPPHRRRRGVDRARLAFGVRLAHPVRPSSVTATLVHKRALPR
jgi:hypothetical protein